MKAMHYRQLIAWQKAMDLVEDVYRISREFPREEVYGLTNQVRRAAVPVPSNIAEGQGRGIGGEFAHHLRIANGSRQELETHILIAVRLGFIPQPVADEVLERSFEVGRIISGLLSSLTGN